MPSAIDRLQAWGPALLWAAFIFSMSTGSFSGYETQGWIELVARTIYPSIPTEGIEMLNAVLRKAGHFSEYFVFLLLLERGFRLGSSLRRAPAVLLAFSVAVLYALTDETHQLFVASRTASLVDCGIDSVGAAAAVLLRAAEIDPLEFRRAKLGA